MYAIVEDGGRQYRVEPGQELTLDYRDIAVGETITLDRVLAVSDDDGMKVGSPTIEGVAVTAEVLGMEQGPKLTVLKFRRRKNSRTKNGHRAVHTRVRIGEIQV